MARISVEIPDELDAELEKLCPWGVKSILVRKLLDNLIEAVKKNGIGVVQLVVEDRYNVLTKEVKGV